MTSGNDWAICFQLLQLLAPIAIAPLPDLLSDPPYSPLSTVLAKADPASSTPPSKVAHTVPAGAGDSKSTDGV